MFLSDSTKRIFLGLDTPDFMALEELKDSLYKFWSEPGLKKDTEFETIWAIAEREGKKKGLIEFLNILHNPKT